MRYTKTLKKKKNKDIYEKFTTQIDDIIKKNKANSGTEEFIG